MHCLRDLTRGGLASGLNEIAAAGGIGISVEESLVPVTEPVRAACELLGLDPLYVANEGRFVAFVPQADAERALKLLRSQPVSVGAACIGVVQETPTKLVTMRSRIGGSRILDMISGEQLPRIC